MDCKKLNTLMRRICSGFRPPENITVTQWADKYRILSSENSAEAGRWRTARTPYLKEIMDSFTDPKVKRIVLVASSQVGKTEALLNILGYIIDQDPGAVLFAHPTKDFAEDFSKRRLAPMIRDTRQISDKVADSKSRDTKNTIRRKVFRGGMMTLLGSNSPADLAGTPARYILGDEIDRWAKDAGGEGDPTSLLEARTSTFYNSKMVQVSTPTVKGASAIEREFNTGTREFWCVQCPHCGEYSYITFNNIKFEYHTTGEGREKQFIVDKAEWICPACGCFTDEYTTKRQPMKWIAESPEAIENGVRSFWINGFYSPWLSWEKIIVKFLTAGKDPQKLQTVYNTLFGQLWENRGDIEDESEVASRAEDYGAELPEGVLCLTCGVDTQGNRLEYEVVGYGFYGENWGIERGVLSGDPATDEPWIKLDGVLDKIYRFKDGKGLKISLAFVDSGGNKTQDVYEQCAARYYKRVFAVKGKGGEGIPYTSVPTKIKYNNDGRVGKVWLYTLGVDSGKEQIMTGLKILEDGARKSHFPIDDGQNGYDANFYNGLLSETMENTPRGWRWVKIPGHERNEALDCRNYANAAFKAMKPNLTRIFQQLKGRPEKNGRSGTEKPSLRKQKKKRDSYSGEW